MVKIPKQPNYEKIVESRQLNQVRYCDKGIRRMIRSRYGWLRNELGSSCEMGCDNESGRFVVKAALTSKSRAVVNQINELLHILDTTMQ